MQATPTATAQTISVPFPDDSSHIIVNGDLGDWNTNTVHTDNASGISTMITTDSSNLYIALHIDDQALQMKTLRMGMEIYFDITGNQSQNMYLSYPIMLQTDDNPQNSFQQSASASGYKNMKQKLIGQDIILQTTGFKITADGMHEKYSSNGGPRVILSTDITNNLVYEASIALKDLYGNNFAQLIKNTPLKIGFRLNAFPKGYISQGGNTDLSAGQKNFSTGGGGMNGGSTTRSGGRNGGGFNGAGRTTGYNPVNIEEMTKDTQFWILAKFN